jgi:hypothetical protein
MLVLRARCGLRLFDDYIVRDGDIIVITAQGQRRLAQAVAADPSLEQSLLEAPVLRSTSLLTMASFRRCCGAG